MWRLCSAGCLSGNPLHVCYDTKELRAPITNTKRIQSVDPEKTSPFEVAHPSGDARSTGTPTTRANESPMKARSVSWKITSIR